MGPVEHHLPQEAGRTERNYVAELQDPRNKWAHNEAFTADRLAEFAAGLHRVWRGEATLKFDDSDFES